MRVKTEYFHEGRRGKGLKAEMRSIRDTYLTSRSNVIVEWRIEKSSPLEVLQARVSWSWLILAHDC